MTRPPRFLTPLLFILAGCTFLWPLTLHPNFVPVHPRSSSDLLLTHLPNALYIRSSLIQYYQLPLWNAQIMSGQPFAADPLSGLWYPPNILLLVLPLPFGFNVLFVLHLAWAGWGLFRFLRDEGLDSIASFFGGLAFAGTPKLIAHLGAGHVSLVFAVAWTPWLLLAVKQAALRGGVKPGALVGAVLALIFLADVRWAFYAVSFGVMFWTVRAARHEVSPQTPRVPAIFAATIFFLLLVAILALPFAEFVRLSARSALTLDDAAAYSLPPFPYLLGLFIPLDGVIHEWVIYIGFVPALLAAVGLVWRRQWFWAAVIAMVIAFSLGSNFFLFPFLYRFIPGIPLLRVPPRVWFIGAMAGCILAAHGIQIIRLSSRLTTRAPIVIGSLFIITAADLIRFNATLMIAQPLAAPTPAAQWVSSRPGVFRVYSPSASFPFPDSLQHAEGVDPLHLAPYSDLMARATGIPVLGYSVAVPFFFVEDPVVESARVRIAASPDARLLGLLNVKYVASEFPIESPGFALAQTFGRTRVYENELFHPRVWIDGGTAVVSEWSPNRITIRVEGQGQLVVSEIAYPGWVVTVDGLPAEMETVEGVLRGVSLESGSHEVVMAFHPASVYAGGFITLAGALGLFGVWVRRGSAIGTATTQG